MGMAQVNLEPDWWDPSVPILLQGIKDSILQEGSRVWQSLVLCHSQDIVTIKNWFILNDTGLKPCKVVHNRNQERIDFPVGGSKVHRIWIGDSPVYTDNPIMTTILWYTFFLDSNPLCKPNYIIIGDINE